MNHNTEDKSWWCRHGEALEVAFVNRFGGHLGVSINPKKESDPYTHDLLCADGEPADLKTQTEPFWTAARYGFHPESTMTLNGKDINRYKKLYPRIVIYFWQQFSGGRNYQQSVPSIEAVYRASLDEIMQFINGGHSVTHSYQRRVNDDRNATHSYLIDTKMIEQVWPK